MFYWIYDGPMMKTFNKSRIRIFFLNKNEGNCQWTIRNPFQRCLGAFGMNVWICPSLSFFMVLILSWQCATAHAETANSVIAKAAFWTPSHQNRLHCVQLTMASSKTRPSRLYRSVRSIFRRINDLKNAHHKFYERASNAKQWHSIRHEIVR